MYSKTKAGWLIALMGAASFGCQSNGTQNTSTDSKASTTGTTAQSAGDSLSLTDAAPLETDSATLTVGGLGCPLCANNIENKLSGMRGVQSVSVDLSTGLVKVGLWGKDKPSPRALAKAVKDSGFTPTRIQTP